MSVGRRLGVSSVTAGEVGSGLLRTSLKCSAHLASFSSPSDRVPSVAFNGQELAFELQVVLFAVWQFRKYSRKSYLLYMTLHLDSDLEGSKANYSCDKMMYHHTKFGDEQFSSSEDLTKKIMQTV